MYELLDFGAGRRLEQFGAYLVDRPAAGTEGIPRNPDSLEAWSRAAARFELIGGSASPQRGRWVPAGALPDMWMIEFESIRFELRPTEFGHLGVFPEQAENWRWLDERIRNFRPGNGGSTRRPKVLNLFAYTGGSTFAAAAAGAEVVHVDSARGTVHWARRNAALSGLAAAPIRWIVEDARRFVERELSRGNRYDAVILDPPSYGHGPKGQSWKLDRDLPGLLADSIGLVQGVPSLVLLSCHTHQITHETARRMLDDSTKSAGLIGQAASGNLVLNTASGKKLPCGVAARFGG